MPLLKKCNDKHDKTLCPNVYSFWAEWKIQGIVAFHWSKIKGDAKVLGNSQKCVNHVSGFFTHVQTWKQVEKKVVICVEILEYKKSVVSY